MTLVRDHFPDFVPEPELPRIPTNATPWQWLRAHGWEQSYVPDRHRVREARVWTHPHLCLEPVTLRLALDIARYPVRRRA